MIYFDHNATTPVDEPVLEAMLPFLRQLYGNPSGLHRLGRLSRGAVDTARQQVAALVGAQPSEVIFTSGGTEANNLALKGLAARATTVGTIAAGATEHPSIAAPLRSLESDGWRVARIPCDGCGRPLLDCLAPIASEALRFATVMLANNETGVITEIEPVAQAVREAGGVMHSDAVQAAGKVKLNFGASAVDLMSVSAHKIYGPKGVGALVSRRAVGLSPLIEGGGQEGGLRGGTENVAGIVGFGKAAELALAELEARSAHLFQLRAQLEGGLREFRGVTIFADDADRLPNTTQFGVCGYDGEALVMNLDRKGLAVSSGSACASGGGEPSPVLTAMGVDPVLAKSAIRVSLGRGNTAAEVDEFLKDLGQLLTHD